MFIVLGFIVLLVTVMFIGYVLTTSSNNSKRLKLKESQIAKLKSKFSHTSVLFAAVERPSDAAVVSFSNLDSALTDVSTDTPSAVLESLDLDISRLNEELSTGS